MDKYQLEQERANFIETISGSRDLAQWRYEVVTGEPAKGLPEGKTWDAVLDLDFDVKVRALGLIGLRFLDDKVYVQSVGGDVFKPAELESYPLSVIASAVMDEREHQELQKQLMAYKDSIIRVFEHVYPLASRTKEVITGEFAKDFSGETKWSRALDFDVPEMPYFKGIRYKNFVDCTNIYALFKDGESKPLALLSKSELGSINNGFKTYLQVLKKRKTAKITYNRYIVSASKIRKACKNRK